MKKNTKILIFVIAIVVVIGIFAWGNLHHKNIDSLIVEVIQPVVGRSFDVDDLILNFAGIIVGYFVAIGTKSLKRKSKPSQ